MTSIKAVPLLDPKRMNGDIDSELREAFARVLTSGRYINGPEVEGLEKECQTYLGVPHAVGVSSGTDALIAALMAVGVRAGDEVICPSYTFFATAGSIWRVGAKPVFVDICPACFNIDPEQLSRKVTPKTKAIIPVHLFGQAATMEPILEIARSRNITVIEDAAQAIGAEYEGKRVGGLGTMGCFSFFPSKNLGGFGDGGLVSTHDAALADELRALRNHGGRAQYKHTVVGGNFRLDAVQAALLRVKLKHLEAYTAKRRAHAALYEKLLTEANVALPNRSPKGCSPGCHADRSATAPILLPVAAQSRHAYNQYVIRVPGEGRRDKLQAALGAKGITTAVYYPLPLHLQPCFAELGYQPGMLPVSEAAASDSLALPIAAELGDDEIRHVAAEIVSFARNQATL